MEKENNYNTLPTYMFASGTTYSFELNELKEELLLEFEPYDRYGESYIYEEERSINKFGSMFMLDLINNYGIDVEEELTKILIQEINKIQ